jgi:hypothetical protein
MVYAVDKDRRSMRCIKDCTLKIKKLPNDIRSHQNRNGGHRQDTCSISAPQLIHRQGRNDKHVEFRRPSELTWDETFPGVDVLLFAHPELSVATLRCAQDAWLCEYGCQPHSRNVSNRPRLV